MIDNKIEELIEKHGSCIIVLKGFNEIPLPKSEKYFSFYIEYYDQVNFEVIDEIVIEEVINNRNFSSKYKWMTIEEYRLFEKQANINKKKIVILENNLYNKQFPYNNTLSNIDNIYNFLYNQEDRELDEEKVELLKKVSFFYGQIDYSKQSGVYYVSYPEFEKEVMIESFYYVEPLKIEVSINLPESNNISIELSDDEIPFLDMETTILLGNNSKNIILIIAGNTEDLPHNYIDRLSIIKVNYGANLFFTALSIKRQTIKNEAEYLRILKKNYGYDQFREIEFYKNIDAKSKETIKISQVQIIDDIVSQIENAMQDEPFRDVYITASTGAGKSIMFQIPSIYICERHFECKPLSIVISPLIGLMNDQVDNMKNKGITASATINGNTAPYEKERIIEGIANQEIDVLYLSPESLQARSDIKMLIGNRNIGVVIVDEAHIVTTWGKSFRADYWYLGIYLAKLRKEYKFPIVTFTATAIYGGKEDMYLDTRNSLNLISPISYFGYIRRNDILMDVGFSEKDLDADGRDYRKTKNTLALRHLIKSYEKNQKSLLYFPTVKLLVNFYNFIYQNEPEIAKVTGKYYGSLQKEEKDEVLIEFKSGELRFVLATKAFGMGIDIPDITNVYHYAPTGSVVDYIQEIGRAARDKVKVNFGFGIIDFLSKDMNEVKQLYGMSAIRKNQIIEVMKKILAVYKEKGNNRNLIISPEDLKYIFVQSKRDEDSLDNKVKTVLLMIEKDFSSPNKLGYSPFVARPRSLFGNDLILVTPELEKTFFKSSLNKYINKVYDINSTTYSSVYQVDLSAIWQMEYSKISFSNFKFSLFNSSEGKILKHKEIFDKFTYTTAVKVTVKNNNSIELILSQYNKILVEFENFANSKKIDDCYFSIFELGIYFAKQLKILDNFEARAFAQTVINAAFEFSKINDIKFITERALYNGDMQYKILEDVDLFSRFIKNSINSTLNPKDNYYIEDDSITTYYFRNRSSEYDSRIAALGIGEVRKLLNYQIIGGNNPQIYIRMNSIYPLEQAIKKGDFYRNSILEGVQTKHYLNVEMLKYLFKKKQIGENRREQIINYTNWFWETIEDYFMGKIPNEVKDKLDKI